MQEIDTRARKVHLQLTEPQEAGRSSPLADDLPLIGSAPIVAN